MSFLWIYEVSQFKKLPYKYTKGINLSNNLYGVEDDECHPFYLVSFHHSLKQCQK